MGPYQGAATGVGGIMRDVFTMGARPIANLNSIHFGSPQNKKTKNLLRGVVHGIGGYGNCMGVPTIAGQTSFDSSYNGNILVNAMTLGLVKKIKFFTQKQLVLMTRLRKKNLLFKWVILSQKNYY